MNNIPLIPSHISTAAHKETFDSEAAAEDYLFYHVASPVDDEEPLLAGGVRSDSEDEDDLNSDFIDEDDHTLRRRITRGLRSWLGMLFMVTASFFFALMSLSVKVMSTSDEKLSPFEIVFLRSGLVYLMAVGSMKLLRIPHPWLGPPKLRLQLILRGALGWGSQACGFTALTLLTLGDATVVGFLSPTLTGFLAFLFLRETWNLTDAGASTFSLLGVVFIARPAFLFGSSSEVTPSVANSNHGLGVTLALCGAVFSSFAFIALRSLSRKISILHSVASLSYVGMILSLLSWPILTIFTPYSQHWVFPTMWSTYFWIIIVGLCGFFGQLLVSRAVQLETAAKAATISYTQVLFAFVLEWAYFQTIPNPWSLAGAVVIGSSVIFVAIVKAAGSTAAAAAASGGMEGAEGALFEQTANGEIETEVLPYADPLAIPSRSRRLSEYLELDEDWKTYLESTAKHTMNLLKSAGSRFR